MDFEKLTRKSIEALNEAKKIAVKNSNSAVESSHLLMALLSDSEGLIPELCIKAGADLITVHYESCENPAEVVRYIKSKGIKAAVAIKPATPAEVLFPILSELDMALVMTVEPGFGGQKMIPEMIEKVRALRNFAIQNNLTTDIQVDGGITAENLPLLTESGANVIVAGSAIFLAEDPSAVIAEMIRQAELHPFQA